MAVNVKEKCRFCRSLSNNPVLGEIVESSDISVHLNCLYTASGLTQKIKPDEKKALENEEFLFGFEIKDIKSEIRRGSRLRCHFCGKTGACVGCVNTKCRLSFHLPCMFEARGFACFNRAFDAFCYKHRPKQDLSQRLILYAEEPPVCCVCLFSIAPESSNSGSPYSASSGVISECNRRFAALKISESSSDSSSVHSRRRLSQWRLHSGGIPDPVASIPQKIRHLKWLRSSLRKCSFASSGRLPAVPAFDAWSHSVIHGGCCRPSWMHRECIASYARSAGLHHLRCPLCLDERVFIPTVIRFGVWVPDRDASWELELIPNPESEFSLEVEEATPIIPPQGLRIEAPVSHTEAVLLRHSTGATSRRRSRRQSAMPSQPSLRPLRSRNRDRQSLRLRSAVNPHVSKKPLFGVEEYDDENKENIDPLRILP